MHHRRYLYQGWDNWTEIEKQWIADVKQLMLEEHGIDLTRQKPFGPRWPGGAVVDGQQKVVNGADVNVTDATILKYIIAREWNMEAIIKDLYRHLEWRQTNIPLPLIEDKVLKLLRHGVLYVHGRAKDLSPLIVIDMAAMEAALNADEIDPPSFC